MSWNWFCNSFVKLFAEDILQCTLGLCCGCSLLAVNVLLTTAVLVLFSFMSLVYVLLSMFAQCRWRQFLCISVCRQYCLLLYCVVWRCDVVIMFLSFTYLLNVSLSCRVITARNSSQIAPSAIAWTTQLCLL